MLACARAQQGGNVEGHVRGGGVHSATTRSWHLAIGDRLEAAGSQHVPGSQAGTDPPGPDEIGVLHPQRLEDVLAQITVKGLAGHVLDDLAQDGEPVVAVDPLGPRLNLHRQAPAVILGQGRHPRSSRPITRADTRPDQIREPPPVANTSGVGQQVPHGGGLEAGLGRDQPEGSQVVVGGRVKVHQALLAQLHHGDGGECLSEGPDPEDGVLRDRFFRLGVRDAVAPEPLQGAAADTPAARPAEGQRSTTSATLTFRPPHRFQAGPGPRPSSPARWLARSSRAPSC